MKNKCKKVLSLVLAAWMLLSVAPVSDFAGAALPTLTARATEVATSGTCGETLTWTLDENGVLTVSGTGAMTNGGAPWYDLRSSVLSVVIEDGVTSIGKNAFYNCNALTNITIPDSVTSIGVQAFMDCSSLAEITIPDSVTQIGWSAFSACTSLTSVNIPDGLTVIEMSLFGGCTSLTSITLPDSITTIGMGAFDGCSSLASINIPDGVTWISDALFARCASLTGIAIPDSVTAIGMKAFYGCTSLAEITVPDSVTSINAEAFSGCTALSEITVPESVASIGENAFYGCTSLVSLTVMNSACVIKDTRTTIPEAVRIYGHADSTAQQYAEKYKRPFAVIGAQAEPPAFNRNNAFKYRDVLVCLLGTSVQTMLQQAGKGATLVPANGNAKKEEDRIGTGDTIVLSDGTQFVVVVLGDINGDGVIATSDARLVLRRAVNLDTFSAAQETAAKTDGAKAVDVSHARQILRAGVGLEDGTTWFRRLQK